MGEENTAQHSNEWLCCPVITCFLAGYASRSSRSIKTVKRRIRRIKNSTIGFSASFQDALQVTNI